MTHRHPYLSAVLAAAMLSAPALAQPAEAEPGARAAGAPRAAAADADMVEGEVRRVDRAMGTILLRHGEIRQLGMGAMTMGFRLRDPKLADGIEPGDKVRFTAVQEGEALVVTRLEKRR